MTSTKNNSSGNGLSKQNGTEEHHEMSSKTLLHSIRIVVLFLVSWPLYKAGYGPDLTSKKAVPHYQSIISVGEITCPSGCQAQMFS